ncbi:hypothetical protein Acr_17g0007950 [Actinidia rufa]|uniref:Integrase catalytic domain-containing protein n=1 Tax=Actinidia rufa TaxID=165716 RepID=A0A7J0G368_9ERIC|nr:hypothetical protein Acr_17g0007950 [Actinidia rufa]
MNENNGRLMQLLTTANPPLPAAPPVPDIERSRHSNHSGDHSQNISTERARRGRHRAPSPSLRERSSSSESSKTPAKARRGRSPHRGDHIEARNKSTSQKIRDLDARLDAINTGTNAPVTVDSLIRQTEPPFTERVLRAQISSKFKLPAQPGIYEGKTDPMDHLDSYKSLMLLQGCSEEVMCKAFSATLKGPARSWFQKTLTRNHRFFWLSQPTIRRQFHELQESAEECFPPIHQKEMESLKDFVKRFNQAILEVEDPSDKVIIMAMMEGLRPGPLFDFLFKNVPETLSALQSKADKYIAAEELAEAKRRRRGRDDHKRKEPDTRRIDYREETRYKRPDRDPKRSNDRRPRTLPRRPEFILPPLNAPVAQNIGDDIGVLRDEVEQLTLADPRETDNTKPLEEVVPISIHPDYPDRHIMIGIELTDELRSALINFLKKNSDIFAWKFAPERLKVIEDEVSKLIRANVVRELARQCRNRPQKGEKWRVSVDFIDLNKACPKDSFPLPKIDLIVDATSKHELLSFMDAFSGYHQIKMYPPDIEKTSFITERVLYCYKVMPFGLKNAGATYQRLVNKMFKEQIRKTMEVYIDDMLVKSLRSSDHIAHLEEAFSILRRYQMMLNPSKCIFGVSSGKFLEFLVTKHGIEHGCGAGLVIQTPFDEQMEYAIRMGFKATNTEAEYEALFAGLRIAVELGAQSLEIFSDSQLVVNQVQGDYLAKDARMMAYLGELAQALGLPIKILQTEESLTWMDKIVAYLQKGTLPKDKLQARRLQYRSARFCIFKGRLYKRSFLGPLLKCLRPEEAEYVLKEIHEGICGNHSGARSLARKTIHQGYFWPTIERDAATYIRRCDKCQRFAPVSRLPHTEIVPMSSPWPFAQFGIPKVIISNNARQFDNDKFRLFCSDLAISHHFFSPGHPQANGQVEVTNRTILRNLKARLERSKSEWAEDLPSILWAYHTTSRIPMGETPYSMVFESNEAELRLNLDLLEEKREKAEIRQASYKFQVAKYYNQRVRHRSFLPGDLVLRRVTLSTKEPNAGKLGPTWEGPYKVIKVSRPGTYWLEDPNGKALLHPWNAEHLKKYYQ